MRILRTRRGFQADHSSSSYLFYAADQPVSKAGQKVAHRFSSRAEVDERSARYQKWGESELSWDAYKALLSEHYDVMASESYDWWTLRIAVPKEPATQAALTPFHDARGYDDLGVEVEDYGKRLAVSVYCMFDYSGPLFTPYEDHLEDLVERLVKIRAEILGGNVTFLHAVASFYGADEIEAEEEEPERPSAPPVELSEDLSKAELQEACSARGITFRKSWTKDQLRQALMAPAGSPSPSAAKVPRLIKPASLSRAAKPIVDSLDRP